MRVVLVLAVAALSAAAQQQPEPAIRTTTRMVQVNIVATDKKGLHVDDLRQSDFVLEEDGKPQQIRFFSVDKGERTEAVASAPQVPAGIFTNRVDVQSGAPTGATAILVDALNTPPGYIGRAQPELAAFLRKTNPRYRTALYSLHRTGIRTIFDFTTDTALLAREVKSIQEARDYGLSEESLAIITGGAAGSDTARPEFGRNVDSFAVAAALAMWSDGVQRNIDQVIQTGTTFRALTAIANRLRGIPGRKSLVWVTTGMPLRQALSIWGGKHEYSTYPEFARLARTLNDANVAVYPVDARGLLAFASNNDPVGGGPTMPLKGIGETTVPQERAMLENIAKETGGKFFYGQKVGEALPAVFDDARISYTVAYYPMNSTYDGKFRRIHLKTTRPGVTLRYREGYVAMPDEAASAKHSQAELLGAVWSPVDATAIPLDAWIERQAGARSLLARVDGGALTNDGQKLALEFFFVQKNSEGKQTDGAFAKVEIPLNAERARILAAQGYTHKHPLVLKPDTAVVRVVVRNPVTGTLGSVSIPVGQ